MGAGALDPDHLGTMIGKHHRGERCRSQTRQFDDAYSCKRLRQNSALPR